MGLPFLRKAEARRLSVVEVLAMSDDEALALFRQLRRGKGEQVICPHCGMAHWHDCRPTRKIWRCAGCQDDFSVTSGTIFAFHKLSLPAVPRDGDPVHQRREGHFCPAGGSATWAYRTRPAYVLLHKIRESLLVGEDECALSGEVHVDGAYVGGRRTRRKTG